MNPGSSEAVRQGCLCPIVKNNRGRDVPWPGVWWVNTHCPLHGSTRPEGRQTDGV